MSFVDYDESLICCALVLPVQFWPAQQVLNTDARRLMRAVLDQAIDDVAKTVGRDSNGERQLYREVWEWLEKGEDPEVFSFETICNQLGVEPAVVRRNIRQLEEEIHNGTRSRRGSRHTITRRGLETSV